MPNFKGCLQLGFSPKAMDWKNEDFYTILKNIKDRETDPKTKAYTRGWNTQGKNIRIGTRVFVYYAKEKKFIASGYICGLIGKQFFNGKERNWFSVTFDWLVDYEKQGLKYQDLKDHYNLSIPFFEKKGTIQGGCAFLENENDLDTLEKAWADYKKKTEDEIIEKQNLFSQLQRKDKLEHAEFSRVSATRIQSRRNELEG